MQLSYFPGCSLHSSAREYDESTRAVCGALGIQLVELDDWNCCGSTSAHSTNAELAQLLAGRNLEIADRAGRDLLVPCAACYGRSKAVESEFKEGAFSGGLSSNSGRIKINHILELLTSEGIPDKLRDLVQRPLSGLKSVCYYGCLTTRPPKVTGATDFEDPQAMDQLLKIAGATTLPWSFKTDCCGASLTLTRSDIVIRLIDRLLLMAEEAGAECIVVACSLCQNNLDVRQAEAIKEFNRSYRIPVLYISELLGLAMGYSGAREWWKKHFVDPTPLLSNKGLL